MDKLLTFFKRFDFPVSTHSLGLFRITYALYNLGLLIQLYLNWQLYFDNIPPYSISLFPVKLGLLLWSLANVFLAAGFFTRYAALANYILVVLMVAYFPNLSISSFNDDLLRIGGFLLIVLPAGKSFSIDTVIRKINLNKTNQTTSYLYYLLALVVSLGLLYFGSGVTKLFSPIWQQGIGLWVPAVMPSYKWNRFSFFVDTQWLMYTLNYVVIVFELAFTGLLFFKKTHRYIALLGIGFHLGIALLFPFYFVSFGPILYYILLIPDSWWKRRDAKPYSKTPMEIHFNPSHTASLHAIQLLNAFGSSKHYHFTEDNKLAAPLFGNQPGWKGFCVALRKRPLLIPLYWLLQLESMRNLAEYASEEWLTQQFQVETLVRGNHRFKRFAFFVLIAGLCGIQLLTLGYHTYTTLKADKQKLAIYLKKRIALQDFSTKPSNLARTFFGINSRGLFLDHAFTGSKTVFALAQLKDSTESWLPIFTKEGYCRSDNRSFSWHKLSFQYLSYNQTQPDTTGLKKYSLLWAQHRQIPLENLQIRVYRRIYPCPTAYEVGYLDKMLDLPWDTVGIIHWNHSHFSYENLQPDTVFHQ
jgi:hypothetical protein